LKFLETARIIAEEKQNFLALMYILNVSPSAELLEKLELDDVSDLLESDPKDVVELSTAL
jgi:hypothetical protein